MIQQETVLDVADNSGAKKIKCIRVFKRGKGLGRGFAREGDIIVASVKQAEPNSAVKKGEVVFAVVVRTRKGIRRQTGMLIRYENNAAVLINDKEKKEPRGTRVFGAIARELREQGFTKILSLAQEVF